MATAQLNGLLCSLRRVVLGAGAEPTDGELLGAFVATRDGAALAALVERHAPMVWGVCRRLLANHHDAEDAFQATFLVLVRKAATIRQRETAANWLYGVARQTAVRARATAAKRAARERQVPEMPEAVGAQRSVWDDIQPLLDQELSRLPDKYRAAIVLCDLEGKTRAEAAGLLECPEGTVAGWLARGRAMLARRLARHGLPVSAAVLGAILPSGASAVPPAAVISLTIQAATLCAAGQLAAASALAPNAVALSEGVLKAMMMTKLKLMAVLLAATCAIALGGAVRHSPAATPADEGERVPAPAAQPKDRVPAKDADLVRGKLASVDAEKNTVTITISTFDRKSGEGTDTNKTFPLAKDAKLLQDDAETKLKDLKKGYPTVIKLDGANAVSVTIDGGTTQGKFLTANAERNTVTVIAGRDDAKRVYHLLKTTKVTGADGKPVKVEDLKLNTVLVITKSVEDDNTAIRIQVQPERGK